MHGHNITGLAYRRGGLFVPALVCSEYFSQADGVALLRDGADLVIIPVLQPGAGGYLLKQCSAAGDRVIHAGPFFHDNGIEDEPVQAQASWDETNGRLVVHGMFRPFDSAA